ncbi:uncharacterized protein LOC100277690 precursor [Zea mays]|uniref:Uncharacterized protein n=1 Tax=Zea mays TaxID=4577 RepID=A0A1D6GN30_MAIZE|nr:uncharacterized protein LOC100277690 precursor [Zea mays]AQK64665.1 hypothetical protein ZEAMMB73_Zm00001d013875 [Zea mays]|eukprot:NP_001144665.2 uncharacterized protein LOC100277690 precursor [Zea mays]
MAPSAPRLVAGALVILAAVALARPNAEQRSPGRYNVADAIAMGSGQHRHHQGRTPPCHVSPPPVLPPPCPGHQDRRREALVPPPIVLGVQRTAPAPPSPQHAQVEHYRALFPPPPACSF